MRNLRQFIKNTIRKHLNENAFSENENLEMAAASISKSIGDEILKQGFNRIVKKRSEDRFVNEYLNGVGTSITTQVHFSNNINVFFKLQLEGPKKTNSTQQEKDRVNSEYTGLFDDIMQDILNDKEIGKFDHLGIDFEIEYFVDGL
jgi:hypothetical protein